MANVTVEVIGNAGGGGTSPSTQQPQVQPAPATAPLSTPPSANTTPQNTTSPSSYVPDNARMMEDVRREMQARGVLMVPGSSTMSQVISQYGQNLRNETNQRITAQYDERRADLRHRYGAQYEDIENRLSAERSQMISQRGPNAEKDPWIMAPINDYIDSKRTKLFKQVGTKQDEEEAALDAAEANERTTAETDLKKAIEELTEQFKNQGSQSENSYIGKLRAQQRELIQQRDSAGTAEEAMAKNQELAEVNEQLRKVMTASGLKVEGKSVHDGVLQASQGLNQLTRGMAAGDMGGMIMGAGSTGVAMAGLSGGAALKALGWIGLAAAVGKELSDTAKDYEAMSSLAALHSPSEGYQGKKAMEYLNTNLMRMDYEGMTFTDMGMDRVQFANEAARRTKQRGMGDDFFNETMRQIGLEKALALDQGALGAAGKYDRYGVNSTDAVAKLVTVLSGIQGSGVDFTDFTRVQEKFDIQQQIMGSYMNRSDRPDYNAANNAVAAFSAVKGITQDARLGSDYATFQNAIQNPANDQMRALVFSTVSDIMPETGGRMDLIDRAIRDPENEGKIMQAVIQRLQSQFGGTDTQMGYFAMKQLFPNIAPERLDEYMSQLGNGDTEAAEILRNGRETIGADDAKVNSKIWMRQATDMTTDYTALIGDIKEYCKQIAGKVTTTTTGPAIGTGPRKGQQSK